MVNWMSRFGRRFQNEIDTIQDVYPGARILRAAKASRYCLTCNGIGSNDHLVVVATIVTKIGQKYPVLMVYPCEFPNRIPAVYPLRPLKPNTPHQYFDNRICLTSNEYDNSVTGAQVLGMAYGWFTCYDIWSKTGKFPPNNYGKHRVRR